MASPADFRPIRLRLVDERIGRAKLREIRRSEKERGVIPTPRSRFAHVGLAAEHAIVHAYRTAKHGQDARLADVLAYDLVLDTPGQKLQVEVKTRLAERGWVHPAKFNYVTVQGRVGRNPIKAAADLILFGWWSADAPRVYWLVGMLRGLAAFNRRAVFYDEGESLPRGGWAGPGGVYALEVERLDPIPAGLFREVQGK